MSATVSEKARKGCPIPSRRQRGGFAPIDWLAISEARRMECGRCECCGRPGGKTVTELSDGRWFDVEEECWRDGQGRMVAWLDYRDYLTSIRQVQVILSPTYLDRDPDNKNPRNLRVLCQLCRMSGQHPRS